MHRIWARVGKTVSFLYVSAVAVFFAWIAVALVAGLWAEASRPPAPPMSNAQNQRQGERAQELCHLAAACKQYDEVRLDCATAGDFRLCLRVKMGDDAEYGALCSGNVLGAPAQALPKDTPNAFDCFFRTLFSKK